MNEREYRTAAEVAADLGVSLRTVRRWIAAGELPAVKIGRSVRVPQVAYAAVLGSGGGPAAQAGPAVPGALSAPGAVAVPVVWRHVLRPAARGRGPGQEQGEATAGAVGETDLAEARRRAADGMDRLVPRGRAPGGSNDSADALLSALRTGAAGRRVTEAGAALPSAAQTGDEAVAPAVWLAGKIVLDTSVVLRWLLRDEDDADRARSLRDRLVAGDLEAVVPPGLPLELAEAVKVAAEHGRISQMAVVPLLRAVESLRLDVPDAWGYGAESLAAAHDLGVDVTAAAAVVCARRAGATLVTANRRLAEAASAAGDSVVWLGDVPA